jgi:hypothetical protein
LRGNRARNSWSDRGYGQGQGSCGLLARSVGAARPLRLTKPYGNPGTPSSLTLRWYHLFKGILPPIAMSAKQRQARQYRQSIRVRKR